MARRGRQAVPAPSKRLRLADPLPRQRPPSVEQSLSGNTGTMSRIFICYRRSDSSAYAGWLHDLLRQHFTKDEVFRDIDSLQGGERWVGRIDETLARCNVVIPVI